MRNILFVLLSLVAFSATAQGFDTIPAISGGVLRYDPTLKLYHCDTLAGEVSGDVKSATVRKLFGTSITTGSPSISQGQVIGYNNSTHKWEVQTVSAATGLTIAAGTTSTPPVKLTSGTNTTSVQNGAIEYDGTDYYHSSGGTRYYSLRALKGSASLDFPAPGAYGTTSLTITVTGAAVGDPVALSVPSTTIAAHGSFMAFVSASNTVTVKYQESDGTNTNLAAATFQVMVFKY